MKKIVFICSIFLLFCICIGCAVRTFSTPEEAFLFKNSAKVSEVSIVLEGEQSAYVAGKEDSSTTVYDIVTKDGDAWRPGVSFDKPTAVSCGAATVYIYRYDDSDDYYLSVGSKGKTIEVSDNRNSQFMKCDYIFDLEGVSYDLSTYYVYVNGLDAEYRITIDGEKYSLV